MPFTLRYVGHRPAASLSYFTGATVDLTGAEVFVVPPEGLVLGRSEGAALRIASSQVARAHARVREVDDGLVVEDLGSTNGTQVNDVRITSVVLRVGDKLTLAGTFDFIAERIS